MGFLSYFEYAQLAGVDVYRPQIEDNSQGQAYSFMETIFDRFTAKQTQATQQGNKALFPGSTTQSGTDQSYITNNAVVYDSFKQLGIDAVTKDTLAFQSNNQLLTYLETSLRPFKKGSSGSHIDRARYQNTSGNFKRASLIQCLWLRLLIRLSDDVRRSHYRNSGTTSIGREWTNSQRTATARCGHRLLADQTISADAKSIAGHRFSKYRFTTGPRTKRAIDDAVHRLGTAHLPNAKQCADLSIDGLAKCISIAGHK